MLRVRIRAVAITITLLALFSASCQRSFGPSTPLLQRKAAPLHVPVASGTPVELARSSEIRVPPGSAAEIDFTGPVLERQRRVWLKMRARLDWPAFGGHNPDLDIEVNGRRLTPDALLNKSTEFTMNDGTDASWFVGGSWRLIYSPSFEDTFSDDPPDSMPADAAPYQFVWDITTLVIPGSNAIRMKSAVPIGFRSGIIVIDGLAVESGSAPPTQRRPVEGEAGTVAQTADTDPPSRTDGELRVYAESVPRSLSIDVRLGDGGAISLQLGARHLFISTRTSEPRSAWLQTSGNAWSRVTRLGRVEWGDGTYRIRRTVTVLPNHVHIADTLTNVADTILGVIVEHRVGISADVDPPVQRLLGGRRVFKAVQERDSPANPTAFVRWNDAAVCVAAFDDIFHVHAKVFSEPGAVGLADPRLAIPPRSSRTLEWDIYVAPRGDYWDVINALRRDRGSNFEIPGPIAFTLKPDGHGSTPADRRWLTTRGLEAAVSTQAIFDDGALAEGSAIPLAREWCRGAKSWVKSVAADGASPALLYLHSQISTEPGAQGKYHDSRLLDSHGEQLVSPYRYPVYLFVPTTHNSLRPRPRQGGAIHAR